MRVFQVVNYRMVSKDKPGDVVARVTDALTAAGEPFAPRFSFSDSPAGGVSAVARILKRFPELAQFAVDAPIPGSTGTVPAISTISLAGDAYREVPVETVLAIAAGIPRAFPLDGAAFSWGPLRSLTLAGEETPMTIQGGPGGSLGAISPSIRFSSSWWINGRLNGLIATLEVPEDTRPKTKLALPPQTEALLAALGKVKATSLVPIPDVSETGGVQERGGRLQQIALRWRRELAARLADLPLPYDLPSAQELGFRGAAEAMGPLKPISVDGLSHPWLSAGTGGQGLHSLTKTTPAGNTLELTIDVGTWSHQCAVVLRFVGFGTGVSLAVPVTAHQAAQYPITSAAQFRQLMENAATVVGFLESTWLAEIEAIGEVMPARS